MKKLKSMLFFAILIAFFSTHAIAQVDTTDLVVLSDDDSTLIASGWTRTDTLFYKGNYAASVYYKDFTQISSEIMGIRLFFLYSDYGKDNYKKMDLGFDTPVILTEYEILINPTKDEVCPISITCIDVNSAFSSAFLVGGDINSINQIDNSYWFNPTESNPTDLYSLFIVKKLLAEPNIKAPVRKKKVKGELN